MIHGRSGVITTVVTVLMLIVAIISIYISAPSGFIIKIYPNTQIDMCTINDQLVFDQAKGITPGSSGSDSGGSWFYVSSIENNNGSAVFENYISVTDIDPPWWTLWRVIKPNRYQVTLTIQNGIQGVDLGLENSSFKAEFQGNQDIAGIPPYVSKMVLRVSPDSKLAPGPHYITVRGRGQDGTESVCTCVLMVNDMCEHKTISFVK
jgi:hypothetical protein